MAVVFYGTKGPINLIHNSYAVLKDVILKNTGRTTPSH
jgi:hypothetical protein